MRRMKSLAAIAVIGAMVSGMGALPAAATYDPCDVNRDGTVSIQDSIYVNRFLMGHFYVSDQSIMDVNGNLIVDSGDSACVLSALVDSDYDIEFTPLTIADAPASVFSLRSRSYKVYDYSTESELTSSAYTLSLSEGSQTSSYAIVGNDDRVEYANSGIVYLSCGGTGFVVGDHTIATAAHCIYSNYYQSYSQNLQITLYDSEGDFVKRLTKYNTTIQAHYPTYWRTPPVTGDNFKYDYALITVSEDLSNYEHFDLGLILDQAENNQDIPIHVAGFPGDVSPRDLRVATGNLMINTAYDDYFHQEYFMYNTDTMPGESGGPVFVTSRYDTNTNSTNPNDIVELKTVIGINTYESNVGLWNQANRMTSEMLQFYLNNPYNTYEE